MEKIYITANDLLLDSFRLAEKIVDSGYRPDFIIGVWRGGAPVGIAIQEYFEYAGITTDHIAIRTSSYTGINQQDKVVRVHGLDYVIDNVNAEDDVLLVDDVFDSGRSVAAVFEKLKSKCRRNMPQNLKVATPWYKPSKNVTDITPDYWVNETDAWLVFPHELVGLTQQEILDNKSDLATTLSGRLKAAL